jgi:hypothetical protein
MITSLLLAAAVSGQTAYTSQNPIDVASCAVVQPAAVSPFGTSIPTVGTLSIAFQNENSQDVTQVAFRVSDGASTQTIVENGTFSKGATINELASAPAFSNDFGAVTCSVQSVAFADGSTWQAQ